MLVLGWVCAGLVLLFLVAIALLGSASLESAELASRLRTAADAQLTRTGGVASPPTNAQRDAMRLLGVGRPVDAAMEGEVEIRTAVGLAAFVGASDVSLLVTEVARRRSGYAKGAARRHAAAVSSYSMLWWVARVWALITVLMRVEMILKGGAWVVRRGLPYWGRLAAQLFGVAAVAGTVIGLLWWMLFESGGDTDGTKWVDAVGVASAIVAAAAAAVFVLRTFGNIVTAVYGGLRSWTVRGVALAVLGVALPVAVFVLFQTGALRRFGDSVTESAYRFQGTSAGVVLIGLVFALGLGALAERAFHAAAVDRDALEQRASVFVVGVLLLCLAVAAVAFALGAPADSLTLLWSVVGVVLLAGVALVALLELVAWIRRYLELRAAGWRSSRWGLRWWMPVAWAGAVASVVALDAVAAWMRSGDAHGLLLVWAVWTNALLSLTVVVGALALCVLSVVSYASVNRAHAAYQASSGR
jgi:hypothetical protein